MCAVGYDCVCLRVCGVCVSAFVVLPSHNCVGALWPAASHLTMQLPHSILWSGHVCPSSFVRNSLVFRVQVHADTASVVFVNGNIVGIHTEPMVLAAKYVSPAPPFFTYHYRSAGMRSGDALIGLC